MRILIASDIHGSATHCKRLLEAFTNEKAEKLILLGDILYHGPRNPLPDGYSPKEVIEMLSAVKDKIICVRGNCDGEVDQMVLPFPILSDYGAVFVNGINLYLSHGHKPVPPLNEGDVYLTGHTHVPLYEKKDGYLHLNPGSVSLPKEDSKRGYILLDGKTFYFKTLDGETYGEVML